MAVGIKFENEQFIVIDKFKREQVMNSPEWLLSEQIHKAIDEKLSQ